MWISRAIGLGTHPHPEARAPPQTFLGIATWFVFAANPPVVARSFDTVKHIAVVDLSHIGFAAIGRLRDLKVSRKWHIALYRVREIAFDPLAMVEIELKSHIGCCCLLDHRERVGRSIN